MQLGLKKVSHRSKMEFIYVVIENGEAYPAAYTNYAAAAAAAKEKHKELLEEYIKEVHYLEDIEHILRDINVPENVQTGTTHLYIEKGINIFVQRLPIVSK